MHLKLNLEKKRVTTELEEIFLKGLPVSEGIAIGEVFFIATAKDEIIPEFSIPTSEVEQEIARYKRALGSSRKDLLNLQSLLVREGSTDAISIIDAHIQMLEDPFMTTFMEEKIRQMMHNTEYVFRSVMGDYEKRLLDLSDEMIRQRLLDVKDLSQRIMRHLHPAPVDSIVEIPKASIVFTKELIPTDIAEMSYLHVGAYVTHGGGKMCHAALIARAKGIPYVVNIDVDLLPEGQAVVIVDGGTGDVIIHPSEETLEKYIQRKAELKKQYIQFVNEAHLDAMTPDGCKIEVLVNIERLDDLDLIHELNAGGIGLCRSEFLFSPTTSEDEQYFQYKTIVEKANGLSVVFRIFDIGGDKGSIPDEELQEKNPALGCRALRLLFHSPQLLYTQIRAILRASMHGDVRMLLPLISDVSEIKSVRKIIMQCSKDLIHEGYVLPDHIMLGSMIEVPSAALTCDIIAKECDFLSMGTNDLIQYTLAADRANQHVKEYYQPLHPCMIRLIKMVVCEAKRARIPFGICGEMASNPHYIPLLLGLGVRQFSCSPRYIPIIKNMIRKVSLDESNALAYKVSLLDSVTDINELLIAAHKESC